MRDRGEQPLVGAVRVERQTTVPIGTPSALPGREHRVLRQQDAVAVPHRCFLFAGVHPADLAVEVPLPVGVEQVEVAIEPAGKAPGLATVQAARFREARIGRAHVQRLEIVGCHGGADRSRQEGIVGQDGDAAHLRRLHIIGQPLVTADRAFRPGFDFRQHVIRDAGIAAFTHFAGRQRAGAFIIAHGDIGVAADHPLAGLGAVVQVADRRILAEIGAAQQGCDVAPVLVTELTTRPPGDTWSAPTLGIFR